MKNMEPAVANSIANALGPVITLLLARQMGRTDKPSRLEIFGAIGVLAGMLALVEVTWAGKSGLTGVGQDQVRLGLGMAIVCGVSMAANNLFSKRLNLKGWSAEQILAKRFYVLLLLAGALLPPHTLEWISSVPHVATVVFVSVLGIIVPLYAFQVGLQKLEPMIVSLLLATLPLVAFGVQVLDRRIAFSPYSLVGVVMVIGFSLLGIYSRFRPRAITARA
jgi:drug/metabolite transporter (DMT)-like permease